MFIDASAAARGEPPMSAGDRDGSPGFGDAPLASWLEAATAMRPSRIGTSLSSSRTAAPQRSPKRTVRGANGKAQHVISAITNHKPTEHVMGGCDAQFRTLANAIPQLAWIARNDGSRFWFNERWFEYTGESLASSQEFGWMRVHDGEAAAAVLDRQRAAFRRGFTWEETVRLRGKGGQHRWFLSRAMPVRDADGTMTQWFGTNTDITDAWMARMEAERAAQARDEILAVLAHDLRDPIHAILGAAAMLAVTVEEDKRRRHVGMIQRATEGMKRLVTDLLDAARLDSGAFAISKEPVELGAVIRQVVELCEPQAAARNLTLRTEIGDAVPVIMGDAGRLLQLLSNLLGNAMKFSPADATVIIRAASCSHGVRVSIEDSGPGIASESLPRIFDRFWQGHGQLCAGVGLGLAICKGIVDAHGGGIWVDSEEGRGTTFYVEIPHSEQSH